MISEYFKSIILLVSLQTCRFKYSIAGSSRHLFRAMIVDTNQPVYAQLPIVPDRSFFPDEPKPLLLQQPHKLAKSHVQFDKPHSKGRPILCDMAAGGQGIFHALNFRSGIVVWGR